MSDDQKPINRRIKQTNQTCSDDFLGGGEILWHTSDRPCLSDGQIGAAVSADVITSFRRGNTTNSDMDRPAFAASNGPRTVGVFAGMEEG